uniref:Band 7 domain-containing protein n=1 Tax=Fibrocapsa japonica TaxID=94617 RepID=A0A7S2V726_9STRA
MEPGVIWCWPRWNRISHVITKATLTYNAPAKDCPTADNVMVNVDLSLTFRIGPSYEAAEKFVYSLGANRLDELLSAKTEEAIRGLVYSVTHERVNDLREEFASGVMASLNGQCKPYGVEIMNVKITEVYLPDVLQERLERTTAFRTKMEEAEKSHENRLVVLTDTATQELEVIKKTNARKLQELNAEIRRHQIEVTEMMEAARGRAQVNEVEAKSRSEVAIMQAQGDVEVAKVNGQREAEEKVKLMEIDTNKRRKQADQAAEINILASEAKLAAADNQAKALMAKAEAEAKAARQLEEKRKFELEWEQLKVMGQIAGNGRKLISGEKGDRILQQITMAAGRK